MFLLIIRDLSLTATATLCSIRVCHSLQNLINLMEEALRCFIGGLAGRGSFDAADGKFHGLV